MERIKHKWMIERAVEIIETVLEEGVVASKDAGDVPEWETKSSGFHAVRAFTHLKDWIRGENDENETNLYHALTRCLMAILRLEDEKAQLD